MNYERPYTPTPAAMTVTALNILDGMDHIENFDALQEVWDAECIGFIEFCRWIVEIAQYSEDYLAKNGVIYFPGVYDYQVSCELGNKIKDHMVEQKRLPEDELWQGWLNEMAEAFFKEGEDWRRSQAVKVQPKVEHMLCVSGVHVPPGYYTEEGTKWPYRVADTSFGILCWVPDEEYEDAPSFLMPIIALAREHKCTYINFDNEGQVIAGLPTYDDTSDKAWVGPKSSAMAAINACNAAGEHMDQAYLNQAAAETLASFELFDEDDFCAGMARRTNIVAQRRADGWFATYDGPKKG